MKRILEKVSESEMAESLVVNPKHIKRDSLNEIYMISKDLVTPKFFRKNRMSADFNVGDSCIDLL